MVKELTGCVPTKPFSCQNKGGCQCQAFVHLEVEIYSQDVEVKGQGVAA